MFSFAGVTSLALLASAVAAPTERAPLTIVKAKEPTGRYIVKLKDGVQASSFSESITSKVSAQWKHIFNGFVVESDVNIEELRTQANVDRIEEEGRVRAYVTQSDAPWGIARLSSEKPVGEAGDEKSLEFTYTYDDAKDPVNVYVIDTGINIEHEDFEGRAKWGKTFGKGLSDDDEAGHGTHCAGTIAGKKYGVAKNANVFAVRVLDADGGGDVADVISGVDWVAGEAKNSGVPTVVSMSLGVPTYQSDAKSLTEAVENLVSQGVHVAVAAGNEESDASSSSPANAKSAVTVGATWIDDKFAWFSNYGDSVDILAPGVNITSAWIGSKDATDRISGTSMATPHVAGLIAYLLGSGEKDLSPADMLKKLQDLAIKDAIKDVPKDTVNLLLSNGKGGKGGDEPGSTTSVPSSSTASASGSTTTRKSATKTSSSVPTSSSKPTSTTTEEPEPTETCDPWTDPDCWAW